MMGSSKFLFPFLCNSVCSLLRVVVRLERRCVYAVGYLSLQNRRYKPESVTNASSANSVDGLLGV